MEGKEKEIEEFQKLLIKYFKLYGYKLPDEVVELVACDFYENNVRKIPEDSVLLSKEEYNKILEQFRQEIITLSQELVNSRRETAEKFREECKKYKVKKFSPVGIDQRDTGVSWIEMPEWKFDEFAKQFGVEVEV